MKKDNHPNVLVDEQELVRQTQNGSKEAFSELVRQHHGSVRKYIARYLMKNDMADDLAQEVFLQAYRGISKFEFASTLKTWLIGIARNLVMNQLRKMARQYNLIGKENSAQFAEWRLGYVEQDPFDVKDRENLLQTLYECLDQLPPEQRQFVDDFYFAGQTAEFMAAQAGQKGSAIRVKLFRIREILRRCIRGKVEWVEDMNNG